MVTGNRDYSSRFFDEVEEGITENFHQISTKIKTPACCYYGQ
jgi:hypothetical protein